MTNSIRPRTIKLFTSGLVCFCIGLVFCVILKPSGLSVNSGISYYGNYRLTIIPYTLAIIGYGIFTALVASHIKAKDLWPLKHSLYIFGFLCLIINITPYSVSSFLNICHTTAGTILFALQLILSGWLIVKLHHRLSAVIFSSLMLISGICAAFYISGPHGFLIQTQIVFQLSFAGLMYLTLNNLSVAPVKDN